MTSKRSIGDLPFRLGRFVLEREIGRGAFGIVYLATDPQLERKVALKVPSFEINDNPKQVERFLREAKSAAGLHHPSIVSVHDAGKVGEHYYIASTFIDGASLATVLRKNGRPSYKVAAAIVAKLANALGYAHEAGVIHRDVKPDNILVDNQGTPYLVDFGLARRNFQDTLQTQDGTILGTPSYMSPEQASGDIKAIDGKSDQWSLGIVLYELLVGQRPFHGNSLQIMYSIQYESIPNPRKHDECIPLDLETICMRCLSRDPNDRFLSCTDLGLDLERWLRDEPILSRRHSIPEQIIRLARQNPKSAKLAMLLTGAILLLAVIALYQWNQASIKGSQALGLLKVAEARGIELSDKIAALRKSETLLVDSNEKLEEEKIKLEEASKTERRQLQQLKEQINEIEQQRSQIEKKTAEKQKAEEEASVAKSKSQEDQQRLTLEQSKNQKLRYVGNITGVQAAMASGQPDLANQLLKETPLELRSIEWQLMKYFVDSKEPHYACVSTGSKIELPEFEFLRSVGFPQNALERHHVIDVLGTSRVIGISSDAKRWVAIENKIDLLEPILTTYGQLESKTNPAREFSNHGFSLRIKATGSPDRVIKTPSVDAWLSPNGRYLACLHIVANLKERPANALPQIIISREVHLYDVDTDSLEPKKETKLYALPLEVFTIRSENTSNTVLLDGNFRKKYIVDCNLQAPPKLVAAFSAESNQLLAAREDGEVSLWDTYKATEIPVARRKHLVLAADHPAVRIDATRIVFALKDSFYVLDRRSLEIKEAIKSAWPIPDPEQVFFSQDGAMLALVKIGPNLKSPNSNQPRLNLFVYSFGRGKWFDCCIEPGTYEKIMNSNSLYQNPDERMRIAGDGIFLIDKSKPELICSSTESWFALQMPNLGLFPYVYKYEDIDFTPVVVRRGNRNSRLEHFSVAGNGATVCAFENGRFFALQKDAKGSWRVCFERYMENESVLKIVQASQDSVYLLTNEGFRHVDIIKGVVSQLIKMDSVTNINILDDRRLVASDDTGNARILSIESGRLLNKYQAQRKQIADFAFDEKLSRLVVGGADRFLTVCDIDVQEVTTSATVDVPTQFLKLNTNSMHLLQVGQDNLARIYKWPSLEHLHTLALPSETLITASISTDGRRLMCVDSKGLTLIEPEYGLVVWEPIRFNEDIDKAAITADQTKLFVARTDGGILEYDIKVNEKLKRYAGVNSNDKSER